MHLGECENISRHLLNKIEWEKLLGALQKNIFQLILKYQLLSYKTFRMGYKKKDKKVK